MHIDKQLIIDEKINFKFEWHWLQLVLPLLSCFLIIGILWLIYMLTYLRKSEMLITNRRLLGQFGVISSLKINVPLDKIDSLGVIQTPFLSIFNAGKVFFYSEGQKYTIPLLTKDSKLLENWFSESKFAYLKSLELAENDVASSYFRA